MAAYLLFRLYGPMAAWGELAVGEYRPSFSHPSKSAVLGLVAAALGITREDEHALGRLAGGYGFAVRVEAPGSLLRDYHTSQVPPAQKKRTYPTRFDELRADTLNTMLSTRDYRCDSLATACLWPLSDGAPHTLADLQRALQKPRFTLYLGRKSCPLAMPLAPRVVEGKTLKDAFDKGQHPTELLQPLERGKNVSLYWEGEVEAGVAPQQTFARRDALLSRRRWQFSERQEYYGMHPWEEET